MLVLDGATVPLVNLSSVSDDMSALLGSFLCDVGAASPPSARLTNVPFKGDVLTDLEQTCAMGAVKSAITKFASRYGYPLGFATRAAGRQQARSHVQ